MAKFTGVVTLLIVRLFVKQDLVNGCRCSPFLKHPQEMVCMADFAFVGKVFTEEKIPGQQPDPYDNNAIYKYKIRLINPIKGTLGNIGSNVTVQTTGNGGMCYRRLDPGDKLFVSGKETDGIKRILSCDLIINIDYGFTFEQMLYFFTTGPYSYAGNCKPKDSTDISIIGCKVPTDEPMKSCYYKTALCQNKYQTWTWVNADCNNKVVLIG